jgi:peroxin-14
MSTPSVFVNSEPMREEQVENAVKFLSHPKVRGSPVIFRRSFLEKKGLTKEEIDESFRRVPVCGLFNLLFTLVFAITHD